MRNRFQKIAMAWLVFFTFAASFAFADEDVSKKEGDPISVKFGGFIDTYYAYDFNNSPGLDRAFTTQPARHNEFNVNLAFLDAKLDAERLRGRLAFQVGTSVQSNYAAEPTVGIVSGPSLLRHIQEAVMGYRVTDKLWIDGGIYLSHLGFEGWVSKDNWTYTRSLMGDFSPYYQSGVKATYQWADSFSTQLHVINGWQNISENNGNKALGFQAAFSPSGRVSLTYNNFFGNEVGTQSRFFNDLIFKVGITNALQMAAAYDVGLQKNSSGDSSSIWNAYAVFVRYQLTPKFSLTARGEHYFDKNQVIVETSTPSGFQTSGASVTADVSLHKQMLWRNEIRGLWSKDAVYPAKSGLVAQDGLMVTSLSVWF